MVTGLVQASSRHIEQHVSTGLEVECSQFLVISLCARSPDQQCVTATTDAVHSAPLAKLDLTMAGYLTTDQVLWLVRRVDQPSHVVPGYGLRLAFPADWRQL